MFHHNNKLLYVFGSLVAGFSIMTVELVSTRIVAPIIGNSIYTWTSVIGVTLLGLSIGSFVGGKIADRETSKPILAWTLFVSAVFIFFIPILIRSSGFILDSSNSILWLNLLLAGYLFLLPAVSIGMIQPIILKKYVNNFSLIGSTYGLLSSAWSVGSIFGVFLTGFFFISSIGSVWTLWTISFILFFMSVVFYLTTVNQRTDKKVFPDKSLLSCFFLFVLLSLLFGATNGEDRDVTSKYNTQTIFKVETNYYNLKVVDASLPGFGDSRLLQLDLDTHSITSTETNENFYPEIYPVFSYLKKDIKNTLIIGAGAYTLPKYLKNYYQNSDVEVFEMDPELVNVGEKYFNLDSTEVKTVIGDARLLFNKEKVEGTYDLIFGDAYNSFISVPWYLLTIEWNEGVKERLTPNGIYAINFISGVGEENSLFARSVLATFKKTFPNYYVFVFGNNPNEANNIVLVGVNGSLPLNEEEFKRKISLGTNAFLAKKLLLSKTGSLFNQSGAPATILTDNFAPTESLLTPVIKDYFPKNRDFVRQLGLGPF